MELAQAQRLLRDGERLTPGTLWTEVWCDGSTPCALSDRDVQPHGHWRLARSIPSKALVEERDAQLAEVEKLQYEVDRLKEAGAQCDAEIVLHKEERLRLRVEVLRLTRERDEARAEVAAAYRRGAEDMREAAADVVKHLSHEDGVGMGSKRIECAIRALPVPEGEP